MNDALSSPLSATSTSRLSQADRRAVCEILANLFPVSPSVPDDSFIVGDFVLDDHDCAELAMALEEELKVPLSCSEVKSVNTLLDLDQLIATKTSSRTCL